MHHKKYRKCDFCKKEYFRENIGKKWCSEKCRFFSKVEIKDCWLWKKGKAKGNYGMHSFDGKTLHASRASFILFKGEIPKGMLVCHNCDNPICVNPDHLFIGSQKDNSQDRAKKGRSANRHGENHPLAKLTSENIKEIFEMKNQGKTCRYIGNYYNISSSQISRILNKKAWMV